MSFSKKRSPLFYLVFIASAVSVGGCTKASGGVAVAHQMLGSRYPGNYKVSSVKVYHQENRLMKEGSPFKSAEFYILHTNFSVNTSGFDVPMSLCTYTSVIESANGEKQLFAEGRNMDWECKNPEKFAEEKIEIHRKEMSSGLFK